jgi:hypothetical protein
MAGTITGQTKRERPKKGQKTTSPQEPKKRERAIVVLMVGSYLTHDPSNVTCVENGINHPTTRSARQLVGMH